MTPQQAHAVLEQGTVLLDLRAPLVFAQRHARGSVNLQFNRADLADRAGLFLSREMTYLLVSDPSPIAKVAEELLTEAGFEIAGVIEGGWRSLADADLEWHSFPVVEAEEVSRSGWPVIDVREEFEFKHGHIEGARFLPASEAWEQQVSELDISGPTTIVCSGHARSVTAASILAKDSSDFRILEGGMAAWREKNLPLTLL
jgi:rhodanese-related sulfurtransferase